MFLILANMTRLSFGLCRRKKTFEKRPCKIFLFFKIVCQPTFFMIWHVFANVTHDDRTNLTMWHPCVNYVISYILKIFLRIK